MIEAKRSQTGILLIEDGDSHTRLSWAASTREVKQKDSLYNRVISVLQRKIRRTKNKFNQTTDARLFELIPQQERLTTGSKDLSLSPRDLVKVLYPAVRRSGKLTLQQFQQRFAFLLRPLKL